MSDLQEIKRRLEVVERILVATEKTISNFRDICTHVFIVFRDGAGEQESRSEAGHSSSDAALISLRELHYTVDGFTLPPFCSHRPPSDPRFASTAAEPPRRAGGGGSSSNSSRTNLASIFEHWLDVLEGPGSDAVQEAQEHAHQDGPIIMLATKGKGKGKGDNKRARDDEDTDYPCEGEAKKRKAEEM